MVLEATEPRVIGFEARGAAAVRSFTRSLAPPPVAASSSISPRFPLHSALRYSLRFPAREFLWRWYRDGGAEAAAPACPAVPCLSLPLFPQLAPLERRRERMWTKGDLLVLFNAREMHCTAPILPPVSPVCFHPQPPLGDHSNLQRHVTSHLTLSITSQSFAIHQVTDDQSFLASPQLHSTFFYLVKSPETVVRSSALVHTHSLSRTPAADPHICLLDILPFPYPCPYP